MIDAHPWQKWYEASLLPCVSDRITGVYDALGQAIKQKGPTCFSSGQCCNFNAHGHRLYVTGLEIAWYCRQLKSTAVQADLKAACPFQIDSLCSTHNIRPLGCRVYFCEAGTQAWQQDLYEQFQKQLVQLHEDQAIPYAYMEWRSGLAQALESCLKE